MFKAIDDYLEETILLILLVLMTAIMGVQIVSRYIFQNSLTWSEELVRYMFVWSAFLGVPFCIKHGLSIKVDQFRNLFPVPLQRILMYIDKIKIVNFKSFEGEFELKLNKDLNMASKSCQGLIN